jgi:hypothetical protein
MNELEQTQYDKYEAQINELADKIGTDEFKKSYSLQKETFKEIIDLFDKQDKIKPHNSIKKFKIKKIKEIYEYGVFMNESVVKGTVKYERMKNDLLNKLKTKLNWRNKNVKEKNK